MREGREDRLKGERNFVQVISKLLGEFAKSVRFYRLESLNFVRVWSSKFDTLKSSLLMTLFCYSWIIRSKFNFIDNVLRQARVECILSYINNWTPVIFYQTVDIFVLCFTSILESLCRRLNWFLCISNTILWCCAKFKVKRRIYHSNLMFISNK